MQSTRKTLPGRDYVDPAIFELERQRIFFKSWYYAGREEQVVVPGQWFTIDVVGESIIVMRNDEGKLQAFYNVCRHRGSRLCDEKAGQSNGAIMCPYHNLCYNHQGELIATPNMEEHELDFDQLSLWPVHVDVWQGFVFVNLSAEKPITLRESLAVHFDEPLRFERFELDKLRIGRSYEAVVNANWKIILENYLECLHCPAVHPELIETIETYKSGWVIEEGRDDGGVSLPPGGSGYSDGGRSNLSVNPCMTALEVNSIYGGAIPPNVTLDIGATGVMIIQLLPISPLQTRVIDTFLFNAADVAKADFDPSPVVDFNEVVSRQDYAVCERVQKGVASRAFSHGVLAEKDIFVYEFVQRYLQQRDN
ncbi:MAG: aromatic ring-hydroxylating oxygenase subunit alpha [Methylophilaceae bacterium]